MRKLPSRFVGDAGDLVPVSAERMKAIAAERESRAAALEAANGKDVPGTAKEPSTKRGE